MSFRDFFLQRLAARTVSRPKRGPTPLSASMLQAFTRKELETALQINTHLRNIGFTLDDLGAFIADQRRQEQVANVQSAMRSSVYMTREQRKQLKNAGRGGRRSRRNDNA